MAFGGIKEGLKMGVKISAWAAAFFYVEDCWDEIRGEKDFLNTVVASLSVAGGFSLWSRLLSGLECVIDVADVRHRSLSRDGSCEDGEDRFGYWACVWIGTGCCGSDEGETTRICRDHIERRKAENGHNANGSHLREAKASDTKAGHDQHSFKADA
jgi:hypothetical protein